MPNNPTYDPVSGRAIHPQDDYDYVRDHLRSDPRRHLPNDTQSVDDRQQAAKARGEKYFPTPWECWNMGKWWNVPEDEQAELIKAETADHAWLEIIEARLAEPSLFHGAPGETPTPWDGSLAESAQWGNIVTNTRIGVLWLRLNPDALGRATGTSKTISSIMRGLGWSDRRLRVPGMSIIPRLWLKPDWIVPHAVPHADDMEQNGSYGTTTRTDDDDIPF